MPFFYWFAVARKFDPAVWKRAVSEHRKWMNRLSELGAPAVMGSRPTERKGKRVNEGFVWTKDGGARGVHLKNYLPNEPGYYEASWYDRGDGTFVPFEAGGWKSGLMICSDMWSMANARSYGKREVSLIAVPRCTGYTSVDTWVAGGKVAAILSGAYCVSSNRYGRRGVARFGGHGWVIDPNGKLLGLTSKSKPFVTVDLDVGRSRKAKKTYPRYALEPD
jgi:N-carbamoylputrescine amidase